MFLAPIRKLVLLLTLAFLPCAGLAGHARTADPAVDDEGFVSLFNGKDLSQWKGATDIYVVRDGSIVCPSLDGKKVDRSKTWNLYTEKEYADFVFRFEFRLSPNANNGLCVRVPFGQSFNELQIIDDGITGLTLKPYQFHGSIYGAVPAKQGCQKPVGEWNCQEVIARGRSLSVKLNGQTIVDVADLDAEVSKELPTWKRPKGHLCFKGHGGPSLEFRNIRIKELD